MSKPIAYAITSLEDDLHRLLGKPVPLHHVVAMATDTVRLFLEDARREGRFDNGAIDALLADLKTEGGGS